MSPLQPIDPYHPVLDISFTVLFVHYSIKSGAESQVLNYRRLNFVALTEFLSCVIWDELLNVADVNEMVERFGHNICAWLSDRQSSYEKTIFQPSLGHNRTAKIETKSRQREASS